MRTRLPIAVLLLTLLPACGGGDGSIIFPPGPDLTVTFRVETVTAANFPVAMAFAPDGRLFYNELQTGSVRIVQNGVLLAQPFVTIPVETSGERGLLGIAIDPNFAANRFVYLYYSDPAGVHRLVRYTESGGVGTNRTVIVDNLPSTSVHNGGNIGFGPDGKLYLSIGDNQDPANSQDPDSPSGKILRFNPDGSIPADNPRPGKPMFAMGLRNSFDFAFDPLAGQLYASENGPNCDDEVNRIEPNANYGWRPGYPCGDTSSSFIAPLRRFNPVIAPTGVTFYARDVPLGWRHSFFMVDFNTGRVQRFTDVEVPNSIGDEVLNVGQHGPLLDIAMAPDGSLYFCSTSAILRIIPE